MNESTGFLRDLGRALSRQWWVVAATVVVALVAGLLLARSGVASYVGSATVSLDPIALGRNAPLMMADRMFEAMDSNDFRVVAAAKSGLSADQIKARVAISAKNKAQDKLTVRVTGTDKAETEKATAAVTQAVIEFLSQKGTATERQRLASVAAISEKALKLAQAQLKQLQSGKPEPWQLVDVEGRIANYEENIVNAQTTLTGLEKAYSTNGDVSVAAQGGGSGRATALLGAGIVGLFAGLLLAALREYLLRRREQAL